MSKRKLGFYLPSITKKRKPEFDVGDYKEFAKIYFQFSENDKLFFETRYLPERTEVHYVDEYGNGYFCNGCLTRIFTASQRIRIERSVVYDYLSESDDEFEYDDIYIF